MEKLVRGYHKDEGPPRCAIKINLMKAYDSVDWPFLFDVMRVMNFPSKYIQWTKQCITTTQYSVIINGCSEGHFKGCIGLRQGDPISPYLFLIVMEAFSSLLHLRVEQGLFSYHPKCRELQIFHLAFADDLFIICEPNVPSFTIINDLLNEFHSFSGLKPNMAKSLIFYAGVDIQLKEELGLILPIPEANLPVR